MKPSVGDIRTWFILENTVTDIQLEGIIQNSEGEMKLELGGLYNSLDDVSIQRLYQLKICSLLEESGFLVKTQSQNERDLSSKSVDGISWSYNLGSLGYGAKQTCLQRYNDLLDKIRKSYRKPGIIV